MSETGAALDGTRLPANGTCRMRAVQYAASGGDAEMTDRYAIVGNLISHFKSPAIHMGFAAVTGQDISYEALLVNQRRCGTQGNSGDLKHYGADQVIGAKPWG